MSSPVNDSPIEDAELTELFAGWRGVNLALAVSGGSDSMALLHLVARWMQTSAAQDAWRLPPRIIVKSEAGHPPPARQLRPNWLSAPNETAALPPDRPLPPVVVLTVDHRLRPEAADEARFVAETAKALGLPHQTLAWAGQKPMTGLQEAARDARYRLFCDILSMEAWITGTGSSVSQAGRLVPARLLITAHHRDDVAETFLMRLARGSGIDGLSGMQEHTVLSWPADGANDVLEIGRPLLSLPKSRLVATLRHRGLRWLEDPSNTNADFERVRVRQAITVLHSIGISDSAIARSAQRLAQARHELDAIAKAAVQKHVRLHNGLCAEIDAKDALHEIGREAFQRVLRGLVKAFGGQTTRQRLMQIELLVAGIVRHWNSDEGTKPYRVTMGGCQISSLLGGQKIILRVSREPGRIGLPQIPLKPGTRTLWDNRFEMTAMPDAPSEGVVRALGDDGWRLVLKHVPSLSLWRLPREVFAALPSIWVGAELLAVPYFEAIPGHLGTAKAEIDSEWSAWMGRPSPIYTASFVGWRAFR